MTRGRDPATGTGRRTFLRRGIAGGGLLLLGGALALQTRGYALDPAIARRLRVLSAKEYLILAAACRRLLAADEAGAPSPDSLETPLVIDDYLAGLGPSLRGDVKALLQLLEHSPPLFALARGRFTTLDAAAQDEVLRGWESSRLDLRRQGLQALKGLAAIGYYDDPRTFALLGYPGPMIGAR